MLCHHIYSRTYLIAAPVFFMVLNETSRHKTCFLLLQLVAQDTSNKTARNKVSKWICVSVACI